MIDVSGSSLAYREPFRRVHYFIEALVRAQYDALDPATVYVDQIAHLTLEPIDWRRMYGGGSSYEAGIYRTRVATYLRDDADHVVTLLGDFETILSRQTSADLDYLSERCRLVVLVNPSRNHRLPRRWIAGCARPERVVYVSPENSAVCAAALRR